MFSLQQMTSPSSNCDTLNGSLISSLPNADLTFDDFLNLNELEDMPDMITLPFSPLEVDNSQPDVGKPNATSVSCSISKDQAQGTGNSYSA